MTCVIIVIIIPGSARGLSPYFASVGYACPATVSPYEYYIDLVSVDYSTPEDAVISQTRIKGLIATFAQRAHLTHLENMEEIEDVQRKQALRELNSHFLARENNNNGNNGNGKGISNGKIAGGSGGDNSNSNSSTAVSMHPQQHQQQQRFRNPFKQAVHSFHNGVHSFMHGLRKFRVLNLRAWRQVIRDKPLNMARLASSLFSALLFGAIYFRMGNTVATIPDRLGLLQVAAVNTAMTSLIKATTSFVTEKRIVQRERRRGAYSVLPYFLSKIVAEVPVSSLYPCLSGALMYKLCGLNPAPGKLLNFIAILVVEAMASTALGMSIGEMYCYYC